MRISLVTLAFSAWCLVAGLAVAGDACAPAAACGSPSSCGQCGSRVTCQRKVCQVVCEVKKEKKYYWAVECEDICPLMPGCGSFASRCCNGCNSKCGGDCCGSCEGCNAKCSPERCPSKCLVPPSCGHPRTVRKLVKKEYECEVPVYKTVVKYMCGDCCGGESAPAAAPGSAVPAAPAIPPAPPVPAPAPKSNQSAVGGSMLPLLN